MYLTDNQKSLVNKILKDGPCALYDTVNNIFSQNDSLLVIESITNTEYRFNYRYIPKEPKGEYSNFVQKIDDRKSKIYTIPSEKVAFYREKSNTIAFETLEPELISYNEKYRKAVIRENRRQFQVLQKIQGLMEEIISLLTMLVDNNIIIVYKKDILPGLLTKASEIKIPKNSLLEIRDEGTYSSIYKTFIRFYQQEIIVIPELAKFKARKYQTLQEWNRKREIKLLHWQTVFVVFAILASTVVSVWTASIAHPTSDEISNITSSIDELVEIVEVLAPSDAILNL